MHQGTKGGTLIKDLSGLIRVVEGLLRWGPFLYPLSAAFSASQKLS